MKATDGLDIRELSTGHQAVFDRDAKTLYLIPGDKARRIDAASRDDVERMVKTGDALALDRDVLVSLYEQFSRIALLGAIQ